MKNTFTHGLSGGMILVRLFSRSKVTSVDQSRKIILLIYPFVSSSPSKLKGDFLEQCRKGQVVRFYYLLGKVAPLQVLGEGVTYLLKLRLGLLRWWTTKHYPPVARLVPGAEVLVQTTTFTVNKIIVQGTSFTWLSIARSFKNILI